MNNQRENLLCRYRYDPLDRLSGQGGVQRFYLKSRLAAEVDGVLTRSIFQHEETVLAQHERGNSESMATLLATDQQRSVLGAVDSSQQVTVAYSPYGHPSGLLGLLGFNGERRDPVTGHYLLGNGYRGFNPVLMRFNSPDSLSPFGQGGLNAYAYCLADPVNGSDPSGHLFKALLGMIKRGKFRSKSKPTEPVGKYTPWQPSAQVRSTYPGIDSVTKVNAQAAQQMDSDAAQLGVLMHRRDAVLELQYLHIKRTRSVSAQFASELRAIDARIMYLKYIPDVPPPPYQQAAKIRSSTAER